MKMSMNNDANIQTITFGPFSPESQLDAALNSGIDALVIRTDGFFPNSAIPYFAKFQEIGVPVFISTGGLIESQSKAKTQSTGAIPLPIHPDQNWGFIRGLESIVECEKSKGLSKNETYQNISARSLQIFDRHDFYDKPEFIELLLKPELRTLADSLTNKSGPIVVDCGHIDSKSMYPNPLDAQTLEQGIVLMKYLKLKGNNEVKLGVLFNDMHMYSIAGKQSRRDVEFLRKQVKNRGTHYFLEQAYRQILDGYGIGREQMRDIFMCHFEGSLNFEARQDLKGDELRVNLKKRGAGFSYDLANSDAERQIASTETGAPLCNLMSAVLNKAYQRKGIGTVIYLRDEMWNCGIRGGAMTSKEAYGTQLNVHSVPFIQLHGKVHTLPAQLL